MLKFWRASRVMENVPEGCLELGKVLGNVSVVATLNLGATRYGLGLGE
jgi:hypothetical protein